MTKKPMEKQEKQVNSGKVDRDIWWRYVSRPIAVFICKHFLFKTNITANQLTIIGTFISIVCAYIISLGGYYYSVLGCLLLQISLIIDCADGTVARYREVKGLFGYYMEELSHHTVPTFLMFGLAINSFRAFGDYRIFYLLGLTIASMHLSTLSKSSKTELMLWHIGLTKKLPTKMGVTKLLYNSKQNLFEKAVFFIIELFNSPAQQQTLLLVVALFGYIHYAFFFFFVFYMVIAIFKVGIEYKSGFKIYGMER